VGSLARARPDTTIAGQVRGSGRGHHLQWQAALLDRLEDPQRFEVTVGAPPQPGPGRAQQRPHRDGIEDRRFEPSPQDPGQVGGAGAVVAGARLGALMAVARRLAGARARAAPETLPVPVGAARAIEIV
jgi:hypothetical protein